MHLKRVGEKDLNKRVQEINADKKGSSRHG